MCCHVINPVLSSSQTGHSRTRKVQRTDSLPPLPPCTCHQEDSDQGALEGFSGLFQDKETTFLAVMTESGQWTSTISQESKSEKYTNKIWLSVGQKCQLLLTRMYCPSYCLCCPEPGTPEGCLTQRRQWPAASCYWRHVGKIHIRHYQPLLGLPNPISSMQLQAEFHPEVANWPNA